MYRKKSFCLFIKMIFIREFCGVHTAHLTNGYTSRKFVMHTGIHHPREQDWCPEIGETYGLGYGLGTQCGNHMRQMRKTPV